MKCPRCGTEFYGDKCPNCGYEPTEYDKAISTLMQLGGVGKRRAEELYMAGYKDIESIAKSDENELSKVHSIGIELAKKIKDEAKKYIEEFEEPEVNEFVTICPVCGSIVPPNATKCPKCGTPVKKEEIKEEFKEVENEDSKDDFLNKVICPHCGALIPKSSKTCPICGAIIEGESLQTPQPMEDPTEVLKRFFGVSEIPTLSENEDESANIRVCPNCGAIVVNKDVCPFCGAKIPEIKKEDEMENEEVELSETLKICPNCGAFVPTNATTCPVCGSSIEQEESVSLSALISQPPEKEKIEEAAEERKEEQVIGEQDIEILRKEVVPDEVSAEDLVEIMSAMSADELSAGDLEEIEKDVKPKEYGVKKKEEIKQVVKPKETIEKKSLEMEPLHTSGKLSFGEKLNRLLYNLGTPVDILSFLPILIAFLYVATVGFLSGRALGVFNDTTSFVSGALAIAIIAISLKTFGEYDKKSKLLGFAFLAAPLVVFLPFSLLFASVLSIVIISVHIKYGINPWIPYVASIVAFIVELPHALEFLILFSALYGSYLIQRYNEVNIPIPSKDSRIEDYYTEGIRAFREKRYYDSIYLLKNALKTKPNDVAILNTLGLAYGRIGNPAMAEKMFKKVIEINPNYKYAWNNLGNVYARREEYERAVECYKKALKIDPEYEDALLNLGYVMIRKGNYGAALKMAERMKAIT